MRASLRCPKCGTNDIHSYLDGLVVEPMSLVRKQRRRARADAETSLELDEEVEALTARYSYRTYLCGACGYNERYFNVPEIISEEEVIRRLQLRVESLPGGVYR